MGNPYESVTVSNYNSNPPSDDGAETPSNRVQWSTHKTKIGDPLKTAIEAVNTNVNAAIGKVVGGAGVISTATTYEVAAGDQGKLVKVTASATITTPDASTVGSPFVFSLLNLHSAAITLDGSGSQTINGSASLSVAPGDGYQIHTDGSNWFATGRKTGTLPRGYIDGCILSNGTDTTNDLNISAGVCRDSTNAVDITVAAMTGKQLDANWAPGGSAGMRNSAAGIANGTYHIYAVAKADGTQDIYAYAGVAGTSAGASATISAMLTALQAETGGTDYIYAALIGSIRRVSNSIKAFLQDGDYFWWDVPSTDIDGSTITNNTAFAITVPLGVKVRAIFNANPGSNNVSLLFSSPDATGVTPVMSGGAVGSAANDTANQSHSQQICLTNTSAQIKAGVAGSATAASITTLGFIHPRCRNF